MVDNRAVAVAQRQALAAIDNSPRQVAQRQQAAAAAPPSNTTGLPDNLKAGVENLSGYSLDDVTVHYNSAKPAQLQAHAYAQGTDIHVAPGQEKHLAHEAWHVVQQKQGRVRATRQMKGGVNVNEDAGLEKEADVMGSRAIQMQPMAEIKVPQLSINHGDVQVTQLQRDSPHVVNPNGGISFFKYNSLMTENTQDDTRDRAKAVALVRLGTIGKKKVDRIVNAGGAQRNGNYSVYEFDREFDKVLVEHTQDDQAIVTHYHRWRLNTLLGKKQIYNTVPHFHAATIPKLAGENRQEFRENLPENFPDYDSIGGAHHFYYITPTTDNQAFTSITEAEITS